jgi:hypothetical protein
MTKRIFVALSADGQPVSQRTTDKAYVAASHGGGSFSSKPSSNHPLRVQEVTKALEWVLTVPMSDGTKHVEKSKAGRFGRTYRVRASYVNGAGVAVPKVFHWFDSREGFDSWAAREAGSSYQPTVWTFIADGHGTQVLRNWPQA